MAELNEVVPDSMKKVRGVWIINLTCPTCGQKAQHGGGSGEKPDLGHRVSHCKCEGYTIVPPSNQAA